MLRSYLKRHPFLRKIAITLWRIPFFLKFYIFFPIKGLKRIIICSLNSNYMKQIRDLKKTNSGKRCFIVATGPSLTENDVSFLNKNSEITFGVNSIYKLYDKNDWRPDYYVCADVEFMQDNIKDYGKTFFVGKAKKCSFTDYVLSNEKLEGNVIYLPINRLLHGMQTIFDNHFKFSLNPVYCFYDYYTVTALAMLIAAYMGFKEIYLLGVDCNYMGKQRRAKGLELKNDQNFSDDYFMYAANQMKKGYSYLNKKLLKHGVTTYNATRGGALEVFPRVNFDEVIGKKS